jgi:CTP:molybdopterin cytidylyltransferase MocA
VVPVFSGKGGHPILLSEKIIDAIIKHKDIQVKLNEFLKDFIKIEVNTNTPSILYNINNPEIYKTIFPLTEN